MRIQPGRQSRENLSNNQIKHGNKINIKWFQSVVAIQSKLMREMTLTCPWCIKHAIKMSEPTVGYICKFMKANVIIHNMYESSDWYFNKTYQYLHNALNTTPRKEAHLKTLYVPSLDQLHLSSTQRSLQSKLYFIVLSHNLTNAAYNGGRTVLFFFQSAQKTPWQKL